MIYLKAISKHSFGSELRLFSNWVVTTSLKFEPLTPDISLEVNLCTYLLALGLESSR
jgi:hypothetical protein